MNSYLNELYITSSMKADEFQRLTNGEYAVKTSAGYNLSILQTCPRFVPADQRNTKYETPKKVSDYFSNNPSEQVCRFRDGFIYFRGPSLARLLDIGPEINRLFKMNALQKYLENIVADNKPQLAPKDWSIFQIESGDTMRNDGKYCGVTFDIPLEENNPIKVCVSAKQKNKKDKIEVDVFFTSPGFIHFDGQEHSDYPVYLDLVTGEIMNPKFMPLEKLMIERY
jgi:hypothetical protein